MGKISRFLLCKVAGWKTNFTVEIPKKCIYCVAPHTSNWDFILGQLAYSAIDGEGTPSFLIKKEWFRFPFGFFFRHLGGVPVDRNKKTSLTDQMVEKFNSSEQFMLAVTPEGTRKANPNWKKGFYYISLKAQVPILLVYFDYKNKVAGCERIFTPTGDFDTDIKEIKEYYKQFPGKYPDQFGV